MVVQRLPCPAHRDDFGVRGRVVLGDVAVPAFTDRFAIGRNDDRADRDFVVLRHRALREFERATHPAFVDRRIDCGTGRTHRRVERFPEHARRAEAAERLVGVIGNLARASITETLVERGRAFDHRGVQRQQRFRMVACRLFERRNQGGTDAGTARRFRRHHLRQFGAMRLAGRHRERQRAGADKFFVAPCAEDDAFAARRRCQSL
jgi:hypothetical protein